MLHTAPLTSLLFSSPPLSKLALSVPIVMPSSLLSHLSFLFSLSTYAFSALLESPPLPTLT